MNPIAIIGSLNIDLVYQVDHFPSPGENVFTSSFDILVGGGKGGNQAVALARLGAEVRMIGLLGRELRGPDYLDSLTTEGIDTRGVGIVDGMPGLGLVAVDRQGENAICVHPGANGRVDVDHITRHWWLVADCSWVLLQNEIPRESLLYVARRAAHEGRSVIFDPAPAVADFPDAVWPLVTILTPNRSELAIVSGMSVTDAASTIAAARRMIVRGVRILIAKAGSDGAWIVTADDVVHIPAYKVIVIDPTAAGDTFNAGLAFGVAHDWDLVRAVRFACAAAALSCTVLGAQTAIPRRAAVETLLASQPGASSMPTMLESSIIRESPALSGSPFIRESTTMTRSIADIAKTLDAAILKPETTYHEAAGIIRAAVRAGVATVCVRPCDIPLAVNLTSGTSTGVCTVVGFPHGTTLTQIKVLEAAACIAAGATEIDMVANYGWIRSGLWDQVRDDIAGVVQQCHASGVIVKVIVETAQLDLAQIATATEVAIEVRADFIKTSTGFNGPGASREGVQTMLATAHGRIRVKPSGGIRDRQAAEELLDLGAQRLGVNAASLGAILGSGTSATAGY